MVEQHQRGDHYNKPQRKQDNYLHRGITNHPGVGQHEIY